MSSQKRRRRAGNAGVILITVLFLLVAVGTAGFIFRDAWLPTLTQNPGGDPNKDPSKNPDEQQPTPDEAAVQRTALLEEAGGMAKGYFYDEAIALLQKDTALIDESVTAKINEIQALKNSLVKYEGVIEHIFFHSLIIYPELAFDDKGHPAEGYNMYMTTVSEFQKLLPLLMDNGFVLYDILETAEYSEADGKWVTKDIYLPEGKRPLIISVDDVNYYEYMKPDGFADKLVIDANGEIATQVQTPSGETIVTRDGDVFPILDDFLKVHPEFSYRGAKGIAALTGYQGAFGYRTTDPELYTEAENQQMLADAKTIADRFKETGWRLACHSYTHNGYFRDLTVTMDQMKYDIDRWLRDVGITTGDTTIYISPFGYLMKDDDPRYRYLMETGNFNFFCFVGSGNTVYCKGDNIMMPRFNMDGTQMFWHPDYIKEHFGFEVSEFIDPARPDLPKQ